MLFFRLFGNTAPPCIELSGVLLLSSLRFSDDPFPLNVVENPLLVWPVTKKISHLSKNRTFSFLCLKRHLKTPTNTHLYLLLLTQFVLRFCNNTNFLQYCSLTFVKLCNVKSVIQMRQYCSGLHNTNWRLKKIFVHRIYVTYCVQISKTNNH